MFVFKMWGFGFGFFFVWVCLVGFWGVCLFVFCFGLGFWGFFGPVYFVVLTFLQLGRKEKQVSSLEKQKTKQKIFMKIAIDRQVHTSIAMCI